MLLVVDIGNSNVVLGVYDDTVLLHHFRISTRHNATADEYGNMMVQVLERQAISAADIHGIVVASVVPVLDAVFDEACARYFGSKPISIGIQYPVPMLMKVDRPSEVGADRIVNAYAAWMRHGRSLILVDLGTATTFDVVIDGAYCGGAIAPGVEIASDALSRFAAKLPRVALHEPESVIGKNTHDAMQSGIFWGYVSLIDGLIAKMKNEIGHDVHVVATGGLAKAFQNSSSQINEVDPFLTLDGLLLLHRHFSNGADLI